MPLKLRPENEVINIRSFYRINVTVRVAAKFVEVPGFSEMLQDRCIKMKYTFNTQRSTFLPAGRRSMLMLKNCSI